MSRPKVHVEINDRPLFSKVDCVSDRINVLDKLITVCPTLDGECLAPVCVRLRGIQGLMSPSSGLRRPCRWLVSNGYYRIKWKTVSPGEGVWYAWYQP